MVMETLTPKQESISIEEILTPEIRTQLQKDLVILSDENSGENIDSIKQQWKEKMPDLDGFLNAIFALPTILEAASTLKNIKNVLEPNRLSEKDRESLNDEKIMALQELSESFGTLSKYLIREKENGDELRIFWEIYEKYSLDKEAYPVFEGIRAGILGQVGVYHLIKSLGLGCSLAHWEEDVFEGTDFIISDSGRAPNVGRLQVKHKKEFFGVGIINAKTYDPTFAVDTKIIMNGKEHLTHFTPDLSFDNLKKSCSSDELAFYVELPDQNPDGSPAIDRITGVPSEALVRDFKAESEIVFKGKFALS
ncbi:MAG: hypothetical protein NTX26_01200 [Candidatus Parcubacteria bacterium]|nr:hypothetical protein [Candidatus Parcubacteria bacterium]